ncbi:hypothetical protein SCG7086_AA_00710 [Chlamydiales bacterium SCGC AG-110-P3]|nr:hypothetical protein SCG7086_AA_00710 [Chlamydiales bacterium SCGC AG-110-P3]
MSTLEGEGVMKEVYMSKREVEIYEALLEHDAGRLTL